MRAADMRGIALVLLSTLAAVALLAAFNLLTNPGTR